MQKLETMRGKLEDIYPLIDPNTIQHAYEIINARRMFRELRKLKKDNAWTDFKDICQDFWTADFAMYNMEDNEPVLYLAPRKYNPIFKPDNFNDAICQMKDNNRIWKRHYRPKPEDIARVVETANTDETLRVRLADLKLFEHDYETCGFSFDTAMKDNLTPAQRQVVERIYGPKENLEANLKMLYADDRQSKIFRATVYVMNPRWVDTIYSNEKTPIAKLCIIGADRDGFGLGCTDFFADVKEVDRDLYNVRAELKK